MLTANDTSAMIESPADSPERRTAIHMLKLVADRHKFTFISQDDMKAISSALSFIDSEPEKFRTSPREASRIRMMCEESLVKLLDYADFTSSSPTASDMTTGTA